MMPAERAPRPGQPELSRRHLLRGAAGLAIGAATSPLWLPETARARSISTPTLTSPTRLTENSPQRIGEASLTAESLPPGTFPVDPGFLDRWTELGSERQNGYALTPLFNEIAEDGKPYDIQYFERAKFEQHPEANNQDWKIQLSRLGAIEWNRTYPGRPVDTTTPIDPKFTEYWNTHGGEYQQGKVLGPAEMLMAEDGKPYYTQFFERSVFEYHPENLGKPGGYEVELKRVGANELKSRYPNGLPTVEPPPSAEKHLLVPRTPSRKTAEITQLGKVINPGGWTDAVMGKSDINSGVDPEFRGMRFMYTRVKSIDRASKVAELYIAAATRTVTVNIPDAVANPDNRFTRAEKTTLNTNVSWNDAHIYGVNPYIDIEGEDAQRNIKGDVAMVFFSLDDFARLESNTANLAGFNIYV